MLAGSITAPRRIELIEIEEPRLAEDSSSEILFEPIVACLCGSDLPYYRMENEAGPVRVGQSLHEMIGRVVETSGSKFSVGQQVLAVPIEHEGLFERFVLSEDRAIPISDLVSIDHALLAQPLGTVLFALRKLPPILDLTVAVLGQGPMGQIFNAVLRNLGARMVIGADRLAERTTLGRLTGADVTVNGNDDAIRSAVLDQTDGAGVDLVVEAVGHSDQALNLAIDLARADGRILNFGVPPTTIDGLRIRDMFWKNLTLHNSVAPDFERDFPLAMSWIDGGRIDLSPLITHRFALAQIAEAFALFDARTDGVQKVLIDFPSRT